MLMYCLVFLTQEGGDVPQKEVYVWDRVRSGYGATGHEFNVSESTIRDILKQEEEIPKLFMRLLWKVLV